ncbi:MAG: AsmA family protein [Desulfuromonadaceae bacterium]|nr:AsmA family protein [Desulfuromonadaceae bacterium]
MNRSKKWLLGAALLALLAIAALAIIPGFIDLNRYRPQIEKQLSALTGRPVTLGGEIDLSLFPWAGFSLSDLHIGNPAGFSEKDFVSAKTFEVRVKLWPLLSKNIEMKRFVVDSPRIVLIKNSKGVGNWENPGMISAPAAPTTDGKMEAPSSLGGLPIQSLAVGEFAIRNGSLLWRDEKSGARNEIASLMVEMKDVSFDRPIQLDLSALVDGRTVTVKGDMGPVGREIGAKPLPFDFAVTAAKDISLRLKGVLSDPLNRPKFDFAFRLEPFSPRQAMQAFGREFPLQTVDSSVFSRFSAKAVVKGTPDEVTLSDGVLELDDSRMAFSLQAREFDKPNFTFQANIDRLDADRYLPPAVEETTTKGSGGQAAAKGTPKTDYTPLRSPVLDGTLDIGELKINNARTQDLHVKVTARNGRYDLNPLTLKLYGGSAEGSAGFDVRGAVPKSSVKLRVREIQAEPLLVDVLDKDNLAGALQADADLTMRGDDAATIKQTLNGQGNLNFRNGAIKGIDLAAMVRNVKTAFGLMGATGGPRPSTDFSALKIPFSLTNGRFDTTDASLASPLLRVKAAGMADLVRETINFRVEPTVVATIKGQDDTKERSGIMVPVLVTGTFSKPIFRPDLEGQVKERLQEALTDPEKFKESLKQDKESLKSLEQQGKELLRGLRFGR